MTKPEQQELPVDNGAWVVHAHDWTVQELEFYLDGTRMGLVSVLRQVAAKTVKKCPWLNEDECSNADAYLRLTIPQWKEVQKRVNAAFADAFQN